MHIVSDTLKSYLMTSIMRRKQRRKHKCRLYAGRIDGECGVKYLGTYKRARIMWWEHSPAIFLRYYIHSAHFLFRKDENKKIHMQSQLNYLHPRIH